MTDGAAPVNSVRTIADLCARASVEEIRATDGAWSVRLRFDHSVVGADVLESVSETVVEPAGPYQFVSQWVGVFHRSSESGLPALAEEGQVLRAGDVVGVIAAMQLQHEVVVDRDGILERFLVQDGTAIEYGQPLLEIR